MEGVKLEKSRKTRDSHFPNDKHRQLQMAFKRADISN